MKRKSLNFFPINIPGSMLSVSLISMSLFISTQLQAQPNHSRDRPVSGHKIELSEPESPSKDTTVEKEVTHNPLLNDNFTSVALPDYRTLFKMYMATHGDVLDEPAMAYEYHLIFNLQASGKAREQCAELRREWSDEFTRAELLARLQPPFQRALNDAKSGKKTAIFRLRPGKLRLGEYDQEKGSFPIEMVVPVNRVAVPRPKTECYIPVRTPLAGAALVPGGYASGPNLNRAFELVFSGVEKISTLTMSKSAAQTYLKQHTQIGRNVNRNVMLELLVETEPVPIATGMAQPVPVRILEARLLDPLNDRVLQSYAASMFETRVTKTPERKREDAVPLTRFLLTLLTLREHPEFIDNKWVVDLVSRHIGAEQRRWARIDGQRKNCRTCNPKRSAFIYEWQKLEKENPKLANGALIDAFVRPGLRWDFVTNEPEWDDRFDALVEVFIFERDQIEGRDPEFAARALLPVWKRHLAAALKRLPRHLSTITDLGTPQYDFDSMSFPLTPSELLKPIAKPLFQTPPPKNQSSHLTVVLPPPAKMSSLYRLDNLPDPIVAPNPAPKFNRGEGAADEWRRALEFFYCRTCSAGEAGFLGSSLALDHRLVLKSISASSAEAEQLTKKLAVTKKSYRGGYRIRANMTFEAINVDLGQMIGGSTNNTPSSPVLNGRLIQVELKTVNEDVIATYGPEDFPNSATAHAERVAAEKAKQLKIQQAAAAKKAEKQRAEEAKEIARANTQKTQQVFTTRFAQCEAMAGRPETVAGLKKMKKCLDELENDQASLQFGNYNLLMLQEAKRTIEVIMPSVESMEQLQKCSALTDRDEMQKCVQAFYN